MSVAAMCEAWTYSRTKGGTLLVMLALADQANEEGVSWSSEASLAAKGRMTERNVRRCLVNLRDLGELEPWEYVDRSGTRRSCYRVTIGDLLSYRGSEPYLPMAREGSVKRKGDPPEYPEGRPDILAERPDNLSAPRAGTPITKKPKTSKEAAYAAEKVSGLDEVYRYWRDRRGKTRSTYDRISPGRRQKIAARLGEFSVDELKQAIDGVARDPWPDRANHDDLTIIFRSHEQVEKFLDLAERGSAAPSRGLRPEEIARRAMQLEEEEAA